MVMLMKSLGHRNFHSDTANTALYSNLIRDVMNFKEGLVIVTF